MTLSGVITLILRFLPNSIALLASYVTVIEDRPIMSVLSPSYSSSTLGHNYNPPCSAVSLRSLSYLYYFINNKSDDSDE